jgi:hypothetical protein
MWNPFKKQVMNDVPIHHVVTHSVGPFAVAAIDRFEGCLGKLPSLVGIKFAIIRVVLWFS